MFSSRCLFALAISVLIADYSDAIRASDQLPNHDRSIAVARGPRGNQYVIFASPLKFEKDSL